eukprot:TRINITY_DN2236_c0_g1_i5.p2 TRINITY_DN2236_c0_g1~~TRINITY_DN2236_c0_g1_i5.p2  ORF type:complete len:142 (-),score=5.23 TRINITY_DN2236_c0_g1_i5:471-896(-)
MPHEPHHFRVQFYESCMAKVPCVQGRVEDSSTCRQILHSQRASEAATLAQQCHDVNCCAAEGHGQNKLSDERCNCTAKHPARHSVRTMLATTTAAPQFRCQLFNTCTSYVTHQRPARHPVQAMLATPTAASLYGQAHCLTT